MGERASERARGEHGETRGERRPSSAVESLADSPLIVVGMTVLGVTVLFSVFSYLFSVGAANGMSVHEIPLMLVGYGFGASFVALFAQLGGGIYTKAAGVGADLVGKVEQGIPEDDPRNPAVIADLVGDNVGDCSARGADLFESIAAEVISAMILAATMAKSYRIEDATGFIMFFCSSFTPWIASSARAVSCPSARRPRDEKTRTSFSRADTTSPSRSPSLALACVSLHARHGETSRRVVLLLPVRFDWHRVRVHVRLHRAVLHRLQVLARARDRRGVYDGTRHQHHRRHTAPAWNPPPPVIVISIAIISAYWCGNWSGITNSNGEAIGGLFGTAVATMGMLSTAAYVLTMGVQPDCRQRLAASWRCQEQPESVRDICDELDAVGNTTKATTKGYAIGSAALASFLLFSAFMDEVSATSPPETARSSRHRHPGGVRRWFTRRRARLLILRVVHHRCRKIGARSCARSSATIRRATGHHDARGDSSAQTRRRHVASSARRSREMVRPGALAVLSPVVVGIVFKNVGYATGQELLGVKAVAAFLMFATVAGILMALFLNTASARGTTRKSTSKPGRTAAKEAKPTRQRCPATRSVILSRTRPVRASTCSSKCSPPSRSSWRPCSSTASLKQVELSITK